MIAIGLTILSRLSLMLIRPREDRIGREKTSLDGRMLLMTEEEYGDVRLLIMQSTSGSSDLIDCRLGADCKDEEVLARSLVYSVRHYQCSR